MSGPGTKPWRFVVPALAILVAIGVLVNWESIKCQLLGICPPPDRLQMNLVKCPKHPFALELAPAEHTPGTTRTLTSQNLAGARAPVTEVQDCQRLVVPGPSGDLRFGPLAAIFASDQLATQFGPPDAKEGRYGTERAAVQIYSNGPYDPLGMLEGSSCLYVWKDIQQATESTPQVVTYDAHMEQALTDGDCLGRPHRSEVTPLEVRVVSPPGVPEDFLPIAARWAGGGSVGYHYLSLRCGNAWCEVGPEGFNSEAPPPTFQRTSPPSGVGYPPDFVRAHNLDRASARVWGIPGWYDQQHLAVLRVDPVTAEKTLVPSQVRATIVPHPLLATLNGETDFDSEWIDVAFAWLPEDIEGYAEKMNFKKGWNWIAYRHGPAAAVLGNRHPKRECPKDDERPTGVKDWWARITSAEGNVAFFCVTRYAHDGLDLPGVVRWRWMANDETTWIRCPAGCCPVE